jgi:hypothetical protein
VQVVELHLRKMWLPEFAKYQRQNCRSARYKKKRDTQPHPRVASVEPPWLDAAA